MRLYGDFENGSAGVTLAVGDFVPDRIAARQIGAGNGLTYESTAYVGSRAIRHVLAGTNFNSYYSFACPWLWPTVYVRGYFRVESGASGSHGLAWGEGSSAMLWSVTADTANRKVFLQDSTGSAHATQAGTFTYGQWLRIEAIARVSPSRGELSCAIFNDAASAQPDETISYTAKNTGASMDRCNVGSGGNTAATYYSDAVQFSDGEATGRPLGQSERARA